MILWEQSRLKLSKIKNKFKKNSSLLINSSSNNDDIFIEKKMKGDAII